MLQQEKKKERKKLTPEIQGLRDGSVYEVIPA